MKYLKTGTLKLCEIIIFRNFLKPCNQIVFAVWENDVGEKSEIEKVSTIWDNSVCEIIIFCNFSKPCNQIMFAVWENNIGGKSKIGKYPQFEIIQYGE